MSKKAVETLYVDQFVDGILDPEKEMLGPVKDGGHIIANTAPGCWGPMITPSLKGGHEVTKPVYVEGAEPGDAIVIRINSLNVTSEATASGNDEMVEGRFDGDAYVAAKCPECGTKNPETVIDGIGMESVRCKNCGADATPFVFTNAYTMLFGDKGDVGLTLNKEAAEKIANDAHHYMKTPDESVQNPIVTFAPHDLVGIMARMRPFLGQLGTTPSRPTPDSHNAGDFGSFLVGAPHDYSSTQEELETHRTDGHLDVNRVRAGAVLICPVKVPGGGVYLGDMHAMQGNGEIAGHTTDVSGIAHLQVHVIKGLNNGGPILLPTVDDLPYTAKPFTAEEKASAKRIADQWNVPEVEESYPISFIGSGPNLNDATENGLKRAADLFGVSVPEIMNRSTITGSIDVGRHPGVITVTFLAPAKYLEKKGLLDLVKGQYETN